MLIISIGNTGLQLGQKCLDHPWIRITGVWVIEGPLYSAFEHFTRLSAIEDFNEFISLLSIYQRCP